MIGRSVNHGIRLVAALALLVAVMTSPIRPHRPSGPSRHPNPLLRNFGIAKRPSVYRGGVTPRPAIGAAKVAAADLEDELAAEVEDEVWATAPPSRAASEMLPSLSAGARRAPIDPGVVAAPRPLRC